MVAVVALEVEADLVLLEHQICRVLRETDRVDHRPLPHASGHARLREVLVGHLARNPVAEVRQPVGDLQEYSARRQGVDPLNLGERCGETLLGCDERGVVTWRTHDLRGDDRVPERHDGDGDALVIF